METKLKKQRWREREKKEFLKFSIKKKQKKKKKNIKCQKTILEKKKKKKKKEGNRIRKKISQR